MSFYKTYIPLILVWLISLPLYAVDIDGDGLQDYQVAAGGYHTCVLDDNGVQCWGSNVIGQTDVPDDMVNPITLSTNSAGNHTCAIDPNGVHCWTDFYGKNDIPNDLVNPVAISAGGSHTCVIDDKGLHCWGRDIYGLNSVPTDVINPVAISAGYLHTCAIDDNGVQCWGSNDYGQTDVPTDLVNPVAVAAGGNHTCAIDDNKVRCWGLNIPGYADLINVPIDLVNPVAIAAGKWHTCAIDDNGLHCWGERDIYGQSNVPTDLINPIAVSAGQHHTCAVLQGNGLRCWGRNQYGQINVPTDLVFDTDNDGVLDGDDPYPLNAPPTLTFTYGDNTNKPIAGINLTLTESDNTVTTLTSDANGEIKLPLNPLATNNYTLSASLTDTGTDPLDLLDAIWILQHGGELRTLTASQLKAADVSGDDEVDILDAIQILQHSGELRVLDPNLVFLDTTTNEALSETTFSPTDTPSITVIRMGDVDQSFNPSD
ncbi:MAG: hypothetical protein P8L74_03365 [Gammaproteobacteria bacterium]|nr:hypothetical protein [Gammaproteobacteria bacterium]